MAQQPLFRQGLIAILRTMTSCEIIGQPTNVGEVLELVRACQPEIALLDTLNETVDLQEAIRRTAAWHVEGDGS